MTIRPFPHRVLNWLSWRAWALRQATLHRLADRAAARSGRLSRALRWPIRGGSPRRRRSIDVAIAFAVGRGDVLMCTPALRQLKADNPGCRVRFYSPYPNLVDGLPFIDEARPTVEAPPDAIWVDYSQSVPPRRHLARILGDPLGLEVEDVRPSCALPPGSREAFLEAWDGLPRPRILVNRRASHNTPNKAWPEASWDDLVNRLLQWATVVEIGLAPMPGGPDSARYVNLTGMLSLDQFLGVIAAADLHVGPDSGPMHVAAAFHVPSVVIYGGYIDPVCTAYEGNINLYTPVPCAPCWLVTPCPIEKICLSRITPEQVERGLKELWRRLVPEDRVRPAAHALR